ncbi:zinc-dependent alcohol dehydrogenase family protein [Actinospica durhamensis]|uniref:Zinc-dependent alcohol dehydrogenase family protein n=1 Tax=Actinospica durhamensis TaxID=1508375 RepID=A0A941ET58_9ACTN|nr:zinc-dependent alcohol dehydrogenase family protein [Actinospica durhamensis]MBR7836738.1 zinc-dependent alcohol dehydrogenase family protein [Actinospica durhamensis]
MRATLLHGAGDIRVSTVPDPSLRDPRDALVRVTHACICGSDLWPYRSAPESAEGRRIGHEFLGVVEAVGGEVTRLAPGDRVIAPFMYSDGTCTHCRAGWPTSCIAGGFWGGDDTFGRLVDGGQGEYVRVPLADGTLVPVPEETDPKLDPALLSLSDVMGTGHHAAVSARVRQGGTVAVVGDGAVGLCGVLAARRLGAARIIALSRHDDRWRLAEHFGATDRVDERDPVEAAAQVRDMTAGVGVDSALECVGTRQAFDTAVEIARPGGAIGYVGVPQDLVERRAEIPLRLMFERNLTLSGGLAPARAYLPDLLADVLAGSLDPGPVFDLVLPLAEAADGYRAMAERTAVKVLLTP